MRIELLGSFQVIADDGRVFAPPGRQSVLLAALAIRVGEVVSTDRLIDAVWGSETLSDPTNALQGRISKLRKVIGRDAVVQRGAGYLLDLPVSAVDARRFDALAKEGHRLLEAGDPAKATAVLTEADSLWRGGALEGLVDASWAAAEANRLEERRLSAIEDRISADLALGQGPSLVAELENLVYADPFRERFRCQLMQALYQAGRQADALRVFAEGRDLLAEELGLDPGVELQRLQTQILDQDPSLTIAPVGAPIATEPGSPPAVATASTDAHDAEVTGRARRIGVLVVDDDPLVRTAVTSILEAAEDIDVIGEADDGAAAVSLAVELTPDVVLMDVRMGSMGGIEATRRLLERTGEDGPRVVVLTTFEQDEYVYRALQAGASGFLLKRTDPHRLADAVRTVAAGDAIIDPSVTRRLLRTFVEAGDERPSSTVEPLERLTDVQRAVFDLVAQGLTDADIAARLGISPASVADHVQGVRATLQARDRTQIVVYAYRHGLVADA